MKQAGSWIVLVAVALMGCKKEQAPLQPASSASAPAEVTAAPTASAETSAEPAPSASATASGKPAPGPSKTIAAGVLKAGSSCREVPRVTNEELSGEPISMGEFSIDEYPYPNDPALPARVNVTRDEAAALCAEQGKRLCTELEWEHACKGPSNTTYEYGSTYRAANCAHQSDLLPGKRAACVSGYGVKDMHGMAFEWTSSTWNRGTSGGLGTVRGGGAAGSALQARCANGQSRATSAQAADVGFRCCSGPENSAEVNLTLSKQPPIVAEASVEAGLGAQMLAAMPADHRAIDGHGVKFTKVWRWHPRDNEELLIAQWTARPTTGRDLSTEIAVFKVCDRAPALVARMKGPVERLGSPGAGADPQRVSLSAKTRADEGDVKLTYAFGAVTISQPDWVQAGNLVPGEAEPAPSATTSTSESTTAPTSTRTRPRIPQIRRPSGPIKAIPNKIPIRQPPGATD